uniref:baculoviral IAP repeat-containing protein 7 isoform X2 n=1 Tax=Callithrix jacchus TaxID=9483 RepID=UPI00159DF5D8|nr:baculoviral IAP repeat-containing protein 7 isoform X2 [Callithrix jacchus]
MLSSLPSGLERHCLPTCSERNLRPCQGPHDTPPMHRACDPRGHPGLFQKAVGPRIFPTQGDWWQRRAYPCCPRVGAGIRSSRRAARHPLGLAICPTAAAELARAAIPSMGPEDSAKCLHRGPEPSPEEHRGPHTLCCPVLGLDTFRAWDHVDGQILGQLRPLAAEEEEDGAGATSPRGPAFPGMGSEELRLASFYDWPLTAGVPPELLAAAGFFHTGQQDKVRCFFCYGGLQSWKCGDDPWTEHAKWFPRTRGKNQKTQPLWPPRLTPWHSPLPPATAPPTVPSTQRPQPLPEGLDVQRALDKGQALWQPLQEASGFCSAVGGVGSGVGAGGL